MPTLPLLHGCAASDSITAVTSDHSCGVAHCMHPSLFPVPLMLTSATAKPASMNARYGSAIVGRPATVAVCVSLGPSLVFQYGLSSSTVANGPAPDGR